MTKHQMTQLEIADALVAKWHAGQVRKDGVTPFRSHPDAVAEKMTTEQEKVIAKLHDILEDTDCTEQDLREAGIDDTTIQFVVVMTHDPKVSYEEYVEEVSQYPQTRRVKIQDILHNLSCTPMFRKPEKYKIALQQLQDIENFLDSYDTRCDSRVDIVQMKFNVDPKDLEIPDENN